jgi:hypothetical protein
MFGLNERASPISEGVTTIRINSQPCKGINLTTWHMWSRRAPWVATVHDDYQRVEPGPPYPSAFFHTYASADTPWLAQTLSHCTPVKYGVGCHPTQWLSKLLSFWDPKKSRMCQYIIKACSFGWPTQLSVAYHRYISFIGVNKVD